MRNVLLLSLLLATPVRTDAQAPAPPATAPKPAPPTTTAPKPAPAQPQATRPAQRRAAQPPASTRSGMAITVTSPQGGTLSGIQVELMGATARSGVTNDSGQTNFPGLQAGTYRLRFSGEEVVTLERDVTLKGGEVADVDVTLTAAPPPKEAPAPAAPAPPVVAEAPVGPLGQAQIASLVDLAEKELDARNPRRELLVSCSANTRTMLVLLAQDQPQRMYDNAEALYYVIAGQGNIRVAQRETALVAGVLAAVPRGTAFTVTRRGNRPLVMLSVLNGEPCEEAR